MATINPWARFQRLIPRAGRYIVTVNTHHSDGTSTCTRRDGATVRLIGTSVAEGSQAWVEGEQINGEAPSLPTSTQFV
jgi:hypothetical protein